jgi:lysophospholipase L1-like esterase
MSSTHHRFGSGDRLDALEEQHDVEDIVPLVRRQSNHFEIISREENDVDSTILGNTWKLLASLLLTAMLLGPWIYSTYKNTHYPASSSATIMELLNAADQLSCAKELGIAYSELFLDIKLNKTSSCRDTASPRCKNPTIPLACEERYSDLWTQAFERNLDMVKAVRADKELDVVFLGDSITEHWLGLTLTHSSPEIADVPKLWKELFDGHALPLALSGDRVNQLLYRIMNGEMPDSLNAKVWWILIGTNDHAHGNTKESLLVGNLAVLEEVMRRKPKADRVVLQGLLPKGARELARSGSWHDYEWINDRMECFSQVSERVSFFNGTSYFLTDDGSAINRTLMFDYLHPSLKGYQMWGPAMIQQLKEWGLWSS